LFFGEEKMKPLHIKTPVILSQSYKKCVGEVYLKLESLQPTGSFKIRGIGNFCQNKVQGGVKHFVSSSGGNAGLAAAYAGKNLGILTTVVVPTSTSSAAIEKIKSLGAKTIVYGDAWSDADKKAKEIIEQEGGCYVHPFDHQLIFSGVSSIIKECAQQMDKPSAIILSVGGGGLFSGVALGLREVGWGDVKIFCVETRGAASFNAALKAGKPVDIGKINTIAVTLGASKVCEQAINESKNFTVISRIVSDKEAALGVINFAQHHRILVEPSCGATLSLLDSDALIHQQEKILVIACGGTGVSFELISQWKSLTE
jgi:L-serine/L-threonine ammonia-lyase